VKLKNLGIEGSTEDVAMQADRWRKILSN